jgi:glycerate dehydrogenase
MVMFTKALFIDFKEGDIEAKYFGRVKKLFKSTEFILRDNPKLTDSLKGTDVIFAKIFTKIDKEVIDAAPNLKFIGVLSTAFDAIDSKYARQKGVVVCNLGGYSTEAVSEFFFAALFEQVRELERAKQQARKEDYSFNKFMGLELKERTLGVVGAGKIGSRIAEIGLGIGMKVIYFARGNKPALDKRGAKRGELDEVLSQSDFISLNLILNKETEGMISKEKIGLLKKGCILISLAPPPLIDQKAMMEKAGRGDITFAFDHSDDISADLAKKFLGTKNCIVYPPTAFRTEEANIARWETFVSNIENFVAGKPQNVVN